MFENQERHFLFESKNENRKCEQAVRQNLQPLLYLLQNSPINMQLKSRKILSICRHVILLLLICSMVPFQLYVIWRMETELFDNGDDYTISLTKMFARLHGVAAVGHAISFCIAIQWFLNENIDKFITLLASVCFCIMFIIITNKDNAILFYRYAVNQYPRRQYAIR
jgi:hypothetical protein